MISTGSRPSECPRPGCSAGVTFATEAEMHAGSPLWRCRSAHRGPRFIGFDDRGD